MRVMAVITTVPKSKTAYIRLFTCRSEAVLDYENGGVLTVSART